MEPANYTWFEPIQEVRTFFGLICKQEAQKEGWADYFSALNNVYYTKEQLLKFENLCYVEENLDDYKWQYRPQVIVYLKSGYHHTKIFDTDDAAKLWIDLIISKSKADIALI
jgi:hypothetical protein